MVLLAMEGGGIRRHLWERLLNRILSELVIVTGWVELNNSPRNAREAPWRQNGTVCTMGKEKGLEGNSELEGEGRRAERGGGVTSMQGVREEEGELSQVLWSCPVRWSPRALCLWWPDQCVSEEW